MLWFTTDVDQIVVQTAHIGVAANNLEDAREAVASGCHDECRGADVDHIVCPVDGGSLTVTITARDESGKTSENKRHPCGSSRRFHRSRSCQGCQCGYTYALLPEGR